jgi:transcriptional regulator with XRE-family HTH domain
MRKVRLDAERLVRWRLRSQLSQRKAAKKCGVSEATYRRLEKGEDIEILTASRVAEHLQVSLDRLRVN